MKRLGALAACLALLLPATSAWADLSKVDRSIGTPGLGAGTFASLQYDTIPATAYPVAEGISSTARSGPKRTPVILRK